MGLDRFKTRRCNNCSLQNKLDYGCDGNAKIPVYLDGEKQTTCPIRPYKDDPHFFSEMFKLYNFREKGFLPEDGSFYDQPSVYIDAMLEFDSAMSDKYELEESDKKIRKKADDEQLDKLRAMGLNITKKNG